MIQKAWLWLIPLVFLANARGGSSRSITNWTREDLLEAKREWSQQGFKMEASEFALTNASPKQIRAASIVTNLGWAFSSLNVFSTIQLPLMKPVSETSSIVSSIQTNLLDFRGSNLWTLCQKWKEENEVLLARAHEAVLETPIQFNLSPTNGMGMLLPHLASVKNCALAFSRMAILELHEGKREEAWNDLLALTSLTGKWQVEPIEISHLVRAAMLGIVYSTAWEALASGPWTDHQLSMLEQLVAGIDLFSSFPETAALERALTSITIEKARQPDPSEPSFLEQTAQSLRRPSSAATSLKDDWKARGERREWVEKWSYIEEGLLLSNLVAKELTLRKTIALATWTEMRALSLTKMTNEFPQLPNARVLPLIQSKRLMTAYQGATSGFGGTPLGPIVKAEIHRRLLLCALALERYRLKHGSLPAELNDLMPDFLESIPRDGIDGNPLRYHPAKNGWYLLYSIGPDGEDNGGKQDAKHETSMRMTKGFDILWPEPSQEQLPAPRRFQETEEEEDEDESKQ